MVDKVETQVEVPLSKLSIIPVLIDYSGPARTDEYFTSSRTTRTKQNGDVIEEAYFRGLKLVGKNIELLKGYKGFAVNKVESLDNSGTGDSPKISNKFVPIASFDDLTVFGHDSCVNRMDQWMLIEEWEEISKIVHM